MRTRMRYHFRGNAEGSTLRLTLGCLLGLELARSMIRQGSEGMIPGRTRDLIAALASVWLIVSSTTPMRSEHNDTDAQP
ncbi:GIY-YIG nuclease family protein [Nonomuraea sp. NPDC049750]|uniref:GIY-YIG nuclease family protein n=1 Tax=Nonomuraea sp. NPDC049750 TaxID=3154738 RepID=UPI0033F8DC4D